MKKKVKPEWDLIMMAIQSLINGGESPETIKDVLNGYIESVKNNTHSIDPNKRVYFDVAGKGPLN